MILGLDQSLTINSQHIDQDHQLF